MNTYIRLQCRCGLFFLTSPDHPERSCMFCQERGIFGEIKASPHGSGRSSKTSKRKSIREARAEASRDYYQRHKADLRRKQRERYYEKRGKANQ